MRRNFKEPCSEKYEPGYFSLVGSVIRRAIMDMKGVAYCGLSPTQKSFYKKDAKEFLSTNQLDRFLKRFGLDEMISPNDIRSVI